MDCLRKEPAEKLLLIPSGVVQGYLAQVLSFEHELSVIAIDASSHHGSITDARAKRIEKYYAAKKCKSRSEDRGFCIPKTVTCRVLSPAMLKDIGSSLRQVDEMVNPTIFRDNTDSKPLAGDLASERLYSSKTDDKSTMVLAGLHACGDLSVTMLRTFMECDEVKAVISIGCCYNLLSEEGIKEGDYQFGFPVSRGAKSANLQLGKNARDLACQSAERWRGLGEAAGLHNFELHTFRAAFQMVLFQCYPEIITRSPAIGRQGKALRRQHHRRILECNADMAQTFSQNYCSTYAKDPLLNEHSSYPKSANKETNSADRYSMFVKFCKSGLGRLGLCVPQDIEFSRLWEEAEEFYDLVGPYWTLRAALGPVLETILLLDRLLFLQEQGNVLIQTVAITVNVDGEIFNVLGSKKTRSSESAGQRQAMNYASYGQWWEAVDTYSESSADYLECRLELFSNSAVIVWNFGLSLRIRPSYSDLTVGIACTLAGSNAIHVYIHVR
ncbi:UNVERIFIED_CONTAM: protein RRNAD1 [Sesamum calycinum]|uniref:Protein RRNAD1 n=1 Tax=Sesamum calycinum TaxID=2727403 RepID=A0AAW2Q5E9_9LAMI